MEKNPHNNPPRKSKISLLVVVLTSFILTTLWVLPRTSTNIIGINAIQCPFDPPKYTSSIFLSNRRKLFKQFYSTFPNLTNIIFVLPTASHIERLESDMELADFRQPANILYIFGNLPVSEGLVAITLSPEKDIEDWEITLFLPNLSIREKVFLGRLPTAEDLKKDYVVDNVLSIDEFETFAKGKKLLSTVSDNELPELLRKLDTSFSEDARQAFFESRFYKSEEELELLRFASKLSAWAHFNVVKKIKEDAFITEIGLASYFTHLTRTCGGKLQAYSPIFGAGKHASVLHFRTGENEDEGYAKITTPNFILVDAAAEYRGYASDITRTYVRQNVWTPQMHEIYKIVQKTQEASINAHGLGASWSFVKWIGAFTLTKELLAAGFLQGGNVFELMYANVWRVFMPHGLGHPVGLDVHDPTPIKYEDLKYALLESMTIEEAAEQKIMPPVPSWIPRPLTSEIDKFDYIFFPGQVVTIEPGVYFIPAWFEFVKSLGTRGPQKYVNWTKIEEGGYEDVGGVRIEDVVVIDNYGRKEIISRL